VLLKAEGALERVAIVYGRLSIPLKVGFRSRHYAKVQDPYYATGYRFEIVGVGPKVAYEVHLEEVDHRSSSPCSS